MKRTVSATQTHADLVESREFNCRRYVQGYEWVESNTAYLNPELELPAKYRDAQTVVRYLSPTDSAGDVVWYAPSDLPNTYLEFSLLDHSDEAIKRFANRYGLILTPERFESDSPNEGVRWSHWFEEAIKMQAAIFLKTISRCDTRSEYLDLNWQLLSTIREADYEDFKHSALSSWPALSHRYGKRLESVRQVASQILYDLVNDAISGHCVPFVTEDGIRIKPTNLLGAMWWQFIRSLKGEAVWHQCAACPKMFKKSKMDADGRRIDKNVCSPACQQKLHRQKVREAKRLAGEGMAAKDIAQQIDARLSAVKNWLKKK